MEGGNVLSREAILAAQDMKREYVDVPEWGGGVYVSTTSARAGLEILYREIKEGEDPAVTGLGILLARTITDEAGVTIFKEDDIPALLARSKAAVDRLVEVALRLNNLGPKAAEDAEKN